MLVAAILFFVMGLVSFALGLYEQLGFSFAAGKIFLITFLFFTFISLIAAISTGKSRDTFV